jgi:hypothetical protein
MKRSMRHDRTSNYSLSGRRVYAVLGPTARVANFLSGCSALAEGTIAAATAFSMLPSSRRAPFGRVEFLAAKSFHGEVK